MKKLLLILLIAALPYQVIQAFPNEPSGALGLTYENSVNDLVKLFPNAKREDVNISGYDQYSVDLNKRLYNLQASQAMLSFMDGKLFSIIVEFAPEKVYDTTGLDGYYSPNNLDAIVDIMTFGQNNIDKEQRDRRKLGILLERRLTNLYGEPETHEYGSMVFILWRGRISGVSILESNSMQIIDASRLLEFKKRFGGVAK